MLNGLPDLKSCTALDFRWNGESIEAIFQRSKPYQKTTHEFEPGGFEEVLKDVVRNQEKCLNTFKIFLGSRLELENRFMMILKDSLALKGSLFQVQRFSIGLTNVDQAIAIAECLDPAILGRLNFIFGEKSDSSDDDKFLEFVGWSNGKRLRVTVTIFESSSINSEEMKKLLRHFSHFQVALKLYKACADQKINLPLQEDVNSESSNLSIEFLETLDESNCSLFGVKNFQLEPLNMDEAMKFMNLLDPLILEKIDLKFQSKIVDLEPFLALVEWKKSEKRLDLVLKLKTLTVDNMLTMNKIPYYYSTFRKVTILYDVYCKDVLSEMDLKYFWNLPARKFEFSKLTKHNFLTRRRIIKSNLDQEICSKVMENPLLMGRITERFQFFDLQNLRKVSSGVRACMDHLKSETSIESYWLELKSPRRITSSINQTYHGSYEKTENGWNIEGKCFHSGDIQSVVLNDFEQNLRHQKTPLNLLTLCCSYDDVLKDRGSDLKVVLPGVLKHMTSEWLTKVLEMLRRRKEPLRVKHLKLVSVTAEEVMSVLPYIAAEDLETLSISDSYSEYLNVHPRKPYPESMKITFELLEVVKTEQWKSVKTFYCHTLPVPTPIRELNLAHLSKVYKLKVQTISNEDVVSLKKKFLNSEILSLRFESSVSLLDDRLHELIGEPYAHSLYHNHKFWYFERPNSSVFLCLSVLDSVVLFRVARELGG